MVIEFIYIWIRSKILILKYGLSYYHHMLVLCDDDPEFNHYALKHLKDFMDRFYLDKVTIVSDKMDSLPNWEDLKTNRIRFHRVTGKKIELLKKIYRMQGAFIRFISLEFPEEKMCKHMVGVNGIIKEDLVGFEEYQLFEYERIMD